MQNSSSPSSLPDLKKELITLALIELVIQDKFRFYRKQVRSDLKLSIIRNNGAILPVLAIVRNNQYVLINGHERVEILTELYSPDHEVQVWVIENELTDNQLLDLIVDLERTRKKGYTDVMSEFSVIHRTTPNQQGQKLDGANRRKEIAERLGISLSQMNKLIRIDKASPSLLHAVDGEIITLSMAMKKAKLIEKKNDDKTDENDGESTEKKNDVKQIGRVFTNKLVDLESLPTCCEACHRPFSTIGWTEIPLIFNQNLKEEDQENTWLYEVA
jgi:hypothetical protein